MIHLESMDPRLSIPQHNFGIRGYASSMHGCLDYTSKGQNVLDLRVQVAIQGISLVRLSKSTDECVSVVTVVIVRGLCCGVTDTKRKR